MFVSLRAGPAPRGWLTGVLAAGLLLLLAAGAPFGGLADAAGNASSAASFIESAQNSDGGFYETHGRGSSAVASLWATAALLAAGKNPQDEHVNNGASAADYLAAHLSSYRSLADLGLLAIVQGASGAPAAKYGRPAAELKADLTVPAIRSDPGGAALAVIGLLALHANGQAAAAGRSLLADALRDGGWGAGGSSDSASTALVLEALAQSGVAAAGDSTVRNGIRYLASAQVNDGSIATSDRTDASSSGDVAATAFTVQALAALHRPQLRTQTGTTVLDGLTSYQQRSTGGLSPFGAYDTGVAPSVTQTAQAYPAFDGIAFPLPYVAPVPAAPKHTTPQAGNHASAGTVASGISSSTASANAPVSAYHGASAAGSIKAKSGRGAPPTGGRVSGAVVGASPAPKLTTRSGRAPAKDYSALFLALGLAAVAVLGAGLDARRPRRASRSLVVIVLEALSRLVHAARRRRALAPAAAMLVGVALIATPVATGMWTRAARGAVMIDAFAPYMHAQTLDRLQGDVSVLDAGVQAARIKAPALEFPHASTAHKRFASANPELSKFIDGWPAIHHDFARLLGPMRASRSDYEAVAALPSFRLFPWLLLAPGAILALLGLTALTFPRAWKKGRWGVATLGVILVLGPVALGLFSTGAKGSRMIATFSTVETRSTVTRIQNDFGSLAIGQGSLRTELPARVGDALPAVQALNRRWVAILGDFTPMLGVMSDNVANYRAVTALPDFSAFPWLFAIPGLVAIAIAVLDAVRAPSLIRRRIRPAEPRLEARSSA